MTGKGWSLAARLKSWHYAFAGLATLMRTQHNAWIHAGATLLVIAIGLMLQVTASDWRWLVLAITLVWLAEALNTAIEYVCDAVSTAYSEPIKHAKDIGAGAVVIAAFAAMLIGALTFGPYLAARLSP